MKYRDPVVNRIATLDWIERHSLSSKCKKGHFTVSAHFVGIHATLIKDYYYENEGQEMGVSPGALEQLALTPCFLINRWLQTIFFQ